MQIKDLSKDLPGGPVVRNPPCNAADSGLISSLGGFPMLQGNWARVLQLLSLHSRAFALQPLSPSTLETTKPESPAFLADSLPAEPQASAWGLF